MGVVVHLMMLFCFYWTSALCAHDNCTDYQLQFEKVFTVPGDAAMINCTLVAPDVFDFAAVPYEVSWRRLETGEELGKVSAGVVVLGETLWLLNVTLEDSGQYQCVVRSGSGCYKLSTELLVERQGDGECWRPRKAPQVLTVGVTDTLSCPLKDVMKKLDGYGVPYAVSWRKGCELVEDGEAGHVYRSKARLKILDVDPQNKDFYTCTLTFDLGGATVSVSETIEAWVQEDYCFLPQVLKPANEIFKAPIGSRLTHACQVFVPCIGKVPQDPMVDIFWLADDEFVFNTDASDPVFTSPLRVWTEGDPSKGVWMERLLTIAHLKEEDFFINYTCIAQSGRGIPQGHFALRPQEPPVIAPIGGALSGVTLVFVAAVAVYFLFKVDIVLCFRMSFPVLYANKDCDGKLFDAYVTYPLNCEVGFGDQVCTFALHVLPQVLEKACGYKLFIAGRDCRPGQAMVDSVQDNMLASRRLLLLYSASSFTCSNSSNNNSNKNNNNNNSNNNNNNNSNNNIGEGVCLDGRRQHECVTAMHRALLEDTLKVILVELEEMSPAQLALFPESLRHLRRKQGAVCWWKYQRTRRKSTPRTCATTQDKGDISPSLSPSSRFWKEMRYHMPVRGTRGGAPERTALLKV
ncbi:interleukin-1 receptor type 1-like [Entelurus aequoreus]|uniref:interleukin-1 receptor type 1-like n=1 Tax=Entelurus aequoreus TaxID=161455 RepID=UPI002B1DD8A7|nr:interleukin-1 receptor type 1-like [Entelurus aequoreus]